MYGLEEMLDTCTAFLECSTEKELVWVHFGENFKKTLDVMEYILGLKFFKTIYITEDAFFVCQEKAHLITYEWSGSKPISDFIKYLHPVTGVIGVISQHHINPFTPPHPLQRLYESNGYNEKYHIWIGNFNGRKHFIQPIVIASPYLYLSAFTSCPIPKHHTILNIKELDLKPKDICLVTTSLGCHAFNILLANVRHVTSVDPNPTYNAILELLAITIQELSSEDIWMLYTGRKANIKELYKIFLAPYLSESTRVFCDCRLTTNHLFSFMPFPPHLFKENINQIKKQRLLERLTISTDTLDNEIKKTKYDKICTPLKPLRI